ncbi:MAG: hypothetical protein WAS27_01895, partial [Candidatus Saccharimonadales bacterium]
QCGENDAGPDNGIVDRELQDGVKLRSADEACDDRQKEVTDSGNDGGEGTTDDDADGHVDDVAAHDELAESLDHVILLA